MLFNLLGGFSSKTDFIVSLITLLLRIPAVLLALSLHESAHGYIANKMGDPTAKNLGRITINPAKHLDPIGTISMLLFGIGWAKPVPVNMYRFKNPKRGMAITALAGPVSNVLITFVFLLLYGVLFAPLHGSDVGGYFLEMIELTAYMSLGLAVFNLIPLPPLDGSKVLFALMSDESYYKLMRYERYGGLVLMVLMMTGVLGKPVSTVVSAIYSNLIPVAQFACDLVVKLFYK